MFVKNIGKRVGIIQLESNVFKTRHNYVRKNL